jgi:hypothetical protein
VVLYLPRFNSIEFSASFAAVIVDEGITGIVLVDDSAAVLAAVSESRYGDNTGGNVCAQSHVRSNLQFYGNVKTPTQSDSK